MEVTLLGMLIEVRLLHLLNAFSSIDFTPLPIVTEVRLVQPSNVDKQIVVTLFGIAIED